MTQEPIYELPKNPSWDLFVNGKIIELFTSPPILHPSKIDNHQMGTAYEELLRRFSEMSNEESGDHFTPRDIVQLLISFVFGNDAEDLKGENKIIYIIYKRRTKCNVDSFWIL